MIAKKTEARSKASKLARQHRALDRFKVKANLTSNSQDIAYLNRKDTEEQALRKATGRDYSF
jgi:hypothetical protein